MSFDKEYERQSDGSWVEWSEDIWGNKRARRCVPPRKVIDCADYHRCSRVFYDNWEARPMDSGSVRVVVVEERHAPPPPVVVERRTETSGAALAGTILGALIGGAIGHALRDDKPEEKPAKKTRRGGRGRR